MARGLLHESTQPSWYYGTASEHATFYQYQFLDARNVYASMIQTESPYYQPAPSVPNPFQDNLKVLPGDPEFKCTDNACDASYAVRIVNSSDILIHGAGLYSWFSNYDQTCCKSSNFLLIVSPIPPKFVTFY